MDVNEYNAEVTGWTRDTRRKIRNRVLRLILNIGPGYEQQKTSLRKYYGEINRIGFSFPYYMVFVHKGAGRGYGGFITGKYTNSKGGKSKTNPLSMGKMGTGKRVPKPWFNPVIEAELPALDTIVSNYRGTKIILNLQRILID